MSITKQIPAKQWGEFFDKFLWKSSPPDGVSPSVKTGRLSATNGNKGRLIKLEAIDREMGDETP